MKHKFSSLIGLVIVLAILLSACQPTTETIIETVVVEKEGETIIEEVEVLVDKQVLIYNSMHGDPEPRAADEEIVKNFMEANPEIEVVHSIVAHEDFKTAIRAYLTASTPPDVLTWFAGNRARFFIDNDQIMDISDVWESEGWNDSYPKGFQALSTVNGNQYFLPTSWYWWAVYYRVSIFDELGLDVPETWEEFLVVNETLKDNGYIPIAIGTKYR